MDTKKTLHSLIPFEDFTAILGLDERDGTLYQPPSLAAFCLMTATFTIEQYCRRRLVKKIINEQLAVSNEGLFLPLREYPVRKILAVYAISNERLSMSNEELIEPEFYGVVPDCGDLEDIPFCLSVSPALRLVRGSVLKVHYWAGYSCGEVPPDLASACLELAAWNMSRYRGRRIGMTGTVRGSGKDGEHLELSMPENVKMLLEPYRRRTI